MPAETCLMADFPIEAPPRSVRRHHRARLRARRRVHWGRDLSQEPARNLARVIDTPTPCSCWMCGNPRRYFGERTRQELCAAQESIEAVSTTSLFITIQ